MLDDDAIARYARQIVVPGIGGAGQERLLASSVLVIGDERGCEQAALYLRAAGVGVQFRFDEGPFHLVLVADVSTLDATTSSALASFEGKVCWYSLGEAGFTSGVHPVSPVPPPRSGSIVAGPADARHDAAACDSAAMACAVLLNLPAKFESVRFEVAPPRCGA